MDKTRIMALALIACGCTVGAANPFSDVEADHWAYDAVQEMVDAGVIEGYPDGTYRGDRNLTRYEMAQMVARAMAHQDRLNEQQQHQLDQLQAEFSDELTTLGVRVDELERRMGKASLFGSVEFTYEDQKDNWNFRGQHGYMLEAQVGVHAQVNDRTEAVAVLSTGLVPWLEAPSIPVGIDQLYVTHHFGNNVELQGGRYDVLVGDGLVLDHEFDGVRLGLGNREWQADVMYGRIPYLHSGENTMIAQVRYDGGIVSLAPFYIRQTKNNYGFSHNIYGVSASVKPADNLRIGGEWARIKQQPTESGGDAWTAYLQLGEADPARRGSFSVRGQYVDADEFAPILDTGYHTLFTFDSQSWLASLEWVPVKQVVFSADYAFKAKYKSSGDKQEDYVRLGLKYLF